MLARFSNGWFIWSAVGAASCRDSEGSLDPVAA